MTATIGAAESEALPSSSKGGERHVVRGKVQVLHDGAALRGTVLNAFHTAIETVRQAAAAADNNAALAVHDYRKALRRARAVVSLVGTALPKDERRAIRRALRGARRAVGATRDHAAAHEAFSDLALGEAERVAADAVLANARQSALPPAEVKQLLAEGAACAAAQATALEIGLPEQIELRTATLGARKLFARASRARRAAKHSKRSFHTWRRRAKELSYQLELLSSHAGAEVAALHHQFDEALEPHRRAVDLMMLRELIETHGRGIADEALTDLRRAVDARLDELVKDTRRASREVFRRGPRKFARRLRKAIERDLEPSVGDTAGKS